MTKDTSKVIKYSHTHTHTHTRIPTHTSSKSTMTKDTYKVIQHSHQRRTVRKRALSVGHNQQAVCASLTKVRVLQELAQRR
jgi:hypothetical protein